MALIVSAGDQWFSCDGETGGVAVLVAEDFALGVVEFVVSVVAALSGGREAARVYWW